MINRFVFSLSLISLSMTTALAADMVLDTPRFSSIDNFRDVAGTQTANSTRYNGTMRSGVFYRSNALVPSDSELTAFNAVGINTVFDLRTQDEIAEIPDILPTGASYQHIDILGNNDSGSNIGSVRPTTAAESMAMMQRVNVDFVSNDEMRDKFGLLFNELATAEGAALFHCTAGKDRTGWTAAILQSIAGVDSQTIMADYLATNEYAKTRVDATLAALPVEAAAVYEPMLTVDASYLQAGLDEVIKQYGDMDHYLKTGLGLSQETIYVLRARMVEYHALPGQENSIGNAAAGINLLKKLQNSELSGRYTAYNYYLQSAIEAETLGGVETTVGGQVYADTASYLLRQPATIDRALQPYINGIELDVGQNKVWAHMLADYISADGSKQAVSSDEQTYGILLGLTHRLNENLSTYGDLGYARGKVESGGGHIDTNTTFIGFGGRYGFNRLEQGLYTELGFNAGVIDYQSQREIGDGLGRTHGDTRGNQLGAKIALGYVYTTSTITVEPSVGMRVSHLHLNNFQETGSELALNVQGFDKTMTSAVANINLGVKPFISAGWTVAPMIKLGYEHTLSSPDVRSQGQIYDYGIEQRAAFDSRNQFKGGVNMAVSRGPLTLIAGGDATGGQGHHGYGGNLALVYAF
ncbi:tyrosine-protein phosphatase [Yersinia pekkanenii]|uniref:Protein tyrosine phosphatase n=1 Tax=Yersinia pekkanenii TaxID=1288385 RepID=A0A0T9PJ25_9GAMM|nr:tyrosine-protein phosphatase [Yersinia pekkanenii]CNH68203.1 protein tyrosine phosphatase [Yersinia pekkanenii]CRY68113.1 protein tyrosine phosphatase [Yersinia pekkanenii]